MEELTDLQAEIARSEAITRELTDRKNQLNRAAGQLYVFDGPALNFQSIIRDKRKLAINQKINRELEKEVKEMEERNQRNRAIVGKFKDILDNLLLSLQEKVEVSPEYCTAFVRFDLNEFLKEGDDIGFLNSFAQQYLGNVVPTVYPIIDRGILNLSFAE